MIATLATILTLAAAQPAPSGYCVRGDHFAPGNAPFYCRCLDWAPGHKLCLRWTWRPRVEGRPEA